MFLFKSFFNKLFIFLYSSYLNNTILLMLLWQL